MLVINYMFKSQWVDTNKMLQSDRWDDKHKDRFILIVLVKMEEQLLKAFPKMSLFSLVRSPFFPHSESYTSSQSYVCYFLYDQYLSTINNLLLKNTIVLKIFEILLNKLFWLYRCNSQQHMETSVEALYFSMGLT